MSDPEVGVVIPTRNRQALLAQTLGTVLGQLDVRLEVVVVDEGSSDGTAAWLRELDDPRVRVIRHDTPRGLSAARNAGLESITAPVVGFTDDDDLWAPTKLATQLTALERSGAAWVVTGAVNVDPALIIIGQQRIHPDWPAILRRNIVPGGGSGALVRTEVVRAVGGFDTTLSGMEDWDLWARLFLAHGEPAAVDEPMVAYRIHGGAMSASLQVIEDFQTLTARYEAEAVAHGLDRDLASLDWFARRRVHAGDRVGAIRLNAAIARRYRRPRSAMHAVAAALRPRLMQRRVASRWAAGIDRGWTAPADSWLVPLRGGRR